MKKLFFIIPLGISIAALGCTGENTTQNAENNEATIQNSPQQTTIKEDVNVDKFAELIAKGGGQILDVRTPGEWAEGTVKGAIKMNFFDADFQEQVLKLDKTKPVYVYCKSGVRSAKAAKQMEELGFTKIYNLLGGFNAWSDAGKEVVK